MSLLSALASMGTPNVFNGPRLQGRQTAGGVPVGPEVPDNQLLSPIARQLQPSQPAPSPAAPAAQSTGRGMSPQELIDWINNGRGGATPPQGAPPR
jgi:hypothetical protein